MAQSKGRVDRSGQFLTGGFLLLMILVGLAIWTSARQREDAAAVQQQLLVKDQLANVLSLTRLAESSQRGFLLTANQLYLQPYHIATGMLPKQVAALGQSLTGTPDEARYSEVKFLLGEKLNELDKTIAQYQAGNKDAALALVNTNEGLTIMQSLRDLIAGMQADQSNRLAQSEADAGQDGWIMQVATVILVMVTLLLAILAVKNNRRRTRRLRAAEAELLSANEVLERKVEERTHTLQASEAALAEANASLERRVAERSRELDRIFRLSTDLLAVMDFEGRFRNVSPAWRRITGWPEQEALTKTFTDFLHPDDAQFSPSLFQPEASSAAQSVEFENRCRRADGGYSWLSWHAVPMREEGLIYIVARDITQEKLRDEQLRQSQKMEVLGQLTGGIAHDFNNLLTIILGSLEMLKRGLADADAKLLRRIDNAVDGGRRAAALTHRLLAFSRRQPLAPKPVDVNRLIAGMSDMLHRTLGETVAVELVAGAGVWPALADANQLENALLNLAVNARDAMPEGGHLTIETQNFYLDEAYTAGRDDVTPGQYVQIAVTDTGIGMSASVQEKAFEPFFTTKPQGQGTGLGLAQVYGFIKQSGGHIAIYSEPNYGTTVKLYLPRLRGQLDGETVPEETNRNADISGSGETILLVEDEDGVRDFASEILEDLGYRVLAAENAETALRIFDANPGIKLLFTDVVLTGPMNGRQLANEILARAPQTVVLFTTGYTRNAIIHHGRLDDGINFIGKPFTATALGRSIRRLLDNAQV